MTRVPPMLTAVWLSVCGLGLASTAPPLSLMLDSMTSEGQLTSQDQMTSLERLRRVARQAVRSHNVPCLSPAFLIDLKERFQQKMDENDDGKATGGEVRRYLQNYNPRVSTPQVQRFISRRDLNGNGVLEFVPEYVLAVAGDDRSEAGAREWFGLEDRNGDGAVSRQELIAIATHLGMTPQQAEDAVVSYYMAHDKDGDDRLTFDEYKALYE